MTGDAAAMDLHLSGGFKVLMGCGGLMSFGVIPLAMWSKSRRWPRRLDAEGVTLRNGERLTWSGLTECRPVTVVNQHGQRITGRLDLVFGAARVQIVPQSFAEGGAVMAFLSRTLGRDLSTG